MSPDRMVTPSIQIILAVMAAVIFAFICYSVFITAFVDPWLEKDERELCLLNFYSANNHTNGSEIYFIGTSQIKEGIDCYLIEDDFHRQNRSYECYNLAVHADSPLRRLTELDPILKTKPEIVIIGITIRDIYKNSDIADSRLMLLSKRISLDDTSAALFDAEQLELMNLNWFTDVISKRIYIISYLNYMTINRFIPVLPVDYKYRNNFKNPYEIVQDLSIEEKTELLNRDRSLNDSLFVEFYENSTNKLALRHMVQEFHENNITVIIVNMPNDPLKSTYISNATRHNYYAYLDSLDTPYYDFEYQYPSSYFYDLTHLNKQGRTAFSHDIAELIIKQVGT